MGFFTDLKEDLSQAVNELMPEDVEQANAEEANAQDEVTTAATQGGKEELESLLERIDSIELLETEENLEIKQILEQEETKQENEEEFDLIVDQFKNNVEEFPLNKQFDEIEEEFTMADKAFGVTEDNFEALKDTYIPEPKNTERRPDMTMRAKTDETAVITEGMTINGDVKSEGSVEIIGTVNGNIDVWGKLNVTGNVQGDSKASEIYAENAKITGEVNSQGSIKIGQSSVIIGNVFATSAVIAGAVKGDIDVQGPVILDTTAIVMGNIKSKSVQINNGAVIEGMCSQCYAEVNPTSFFEDFKKSKSSKK